MGPVGRTAKMARVATNEVDSFEAQSCQSHEFKDGAEANINAHRHHDLPCAGYVTPSHPLGTGVRMKQIA